MVTGFLMSFSAASEEDAGFSTRNTYPENCDFDRSAYFRFVFLTRPVYSVCSVVFNV